MQLQRSDKWILALGACYGLILIAGGCALRWAADLYWWATVLLFAPRWIWALPLPVFLVPALWRRSRVPLATLGVLALLNFWILQFHVPWRQIFPSSHSRLELRLLSLNCDSERLDPEKLRGLVAEFDPDVVALQAVEPRDFITVFQPPGWYVQFDTQLALASRLPLRAVEPLHSPELGMISGDFRRYELDDDGQSIQLINVHLASPREGLSAVISRWWNGAEALEANSRHRWLEAQALRRWTADRENLIVVGDFNTPGESPVIRDNFDGFTDAMSAGWGLGNTFWTAWWNGIRIDHVLFKGVWSCQSIAVGPDMGGEHRPLLVVLEGDPASSPRREDSKPRRAAD